jgi:hypothetical protein
MGVSGLSPRISCFLLRLDQPARLLCVVKDDAERVAVSGMKATDTVAKIHARRPTRALRRTMIDGECYSIALSERHDFGSGQSSRILFDQQKLTARKVATGFGEQDHNLHRERQLPIEILMHAAVIAIAVL